MRTKNRRGESPVGRRYHSGGRTDEPREELPIEEGIDPRRRLPALNRQERPKFALQNTGGPTVVAGDPKIRDALAYALATDGEERDRLTHGFHSYPARMHWVTAERVLEALDVKGARVLDPFCGSGTVLVEARVRGFEAMGVDLNPLAVRLSHVKVDPLDRARRRDLEQLGTELREASEERVRARDPVRADLPPTELRWYEPHVLKEMAGLFELIGSLENEPLREVLTMVFSSLVVKFSRQRSDTAEEVHERRIRKGLVSEFFERKVSELCDRLEDLEQGAEPGPTPRVEQGDAHWLRELVARGAVDLVFTSPPYGGTYDYASHHTRRLAWLGIRSDELAAKEIGARRRQAAPESFERELGLALRSMRSTMARDGMMVLLMGDGQHAGNRVRADQLVEKLADDAGLEPLALASQQRVDFSQVAEPRLEHLMALRAK